MGTVRVKTQTGTLEFKIKGDNPNPVELAAIRRIVTSQALPERSERRAVQQDEQLFDRTTGIQDLKLRRKLSRADTAEDEALALKSMGLSENEYLRDARGRLALTPAGAKKFGVDSDRNVMIDERGFSRADFADLSSLGRELVGGVGGALAGQAFIPIPVVGAMIGAGLGTGSAKLVEEGQEYLEGTQGQEASEVFKDAAKEGALAAAFEGAGQVVFSTIGKLFGKPQLGKNLTEEQLELAGLSMDKFGIKPTLSQVGATKPIARQQGITEKVIGTSKRTRDNHNAIINKLDEFRNNYGASTTDEVADVLTDAAKKGASNIQTFRKSLTKDVINLMKQTNQSLGAAASKDQAIDDNLFEMLTTAFTKFDDEMKTQFSVINNLIDDASGKKALFNVEAIKKDAARELEDLVNITSGKGNLGIKKQMLEEITSIPDEASFAQIYNARKQLNDKWLSNYGSSNVTKVKDKFLRRLDNKLGTRSINSLINKGAMEGLTTTQKNMFTSAAKQLPTIRRNFREGIKQFEDLRGNLGLKDLVRSVRNEETIDVSKAAMSLVKPDNPSFLKRASKAVGGDSVFEPIKNRIAGEWLRDTFKKSTKAGRTGAISTHKFYDEIEKLGSTADELFGANTAEIKKLAEQMNALSLSNVSASMIDEVARAGVDEPVVGLLKNLKSALDEQSAMNRSRAFTRLQDDSLSPTAAAEVIADRGTKDTDVAKLIKYFQDPQDLDKIRSFYMDNIIGDFGDTFLTEPKQFKLFGNRLQEEYKTGKLDTIFGKEMAKDMNDFGRVMVFNSKAVEGGDLVAANIAAKPLENLGTIARLFVVGRLFSSAPHYNSVLKQYRRMSQGKDVRTKAEILGTLLSDAFGSFISQAPPQLIQEGTQETKKQVEALASNVIGDRVPQVSSLRRPTATRQSTSVPQVLPPVTTTQAQPVSNQNIRQRAKENPAIAATLLGGLGSAGLL